MATEEEYMASQKEECQANSFRNWLEQQSDRDLSIILFNIVCKLMDKDGKVKDFNRCWVINTIRELDYTGEFDVGFEDTRNLI